MLGGLVRPTAPQEDSFMALDRFTYVAGILAALSLAGCSSEDTESGDTQPSGTAPQFEELLAYDWSIAPGEENYYCIFHTVTEDTWVNEYRPLNPLGTHHVGIGYVDTPRADGVVLYGEEIRPGVTCSGVTLGDRLAFGGLVGTGGYKFPDGVAVKLSAGQQLLLSVHVANPSAEPLSGRTGIEVIKAGPADVTDEAEMIFVNNAGINVTPGASTQTGACTLDADSTFLTLIHHMHETGVHMTTRALPAGGEPRVLLDADYVFNEQSVVPLEPSVALAAGDKIEVTCNYENPGTNTLTFGESTYDSEMCISIMYRYPASATNFNCVAVP
jgi:hypothetical protein